MLSNQHVLLATLGGQPQVVTFTLDLLLPTYPIDEVIVLHPAATSVRLQHSLACLQTEFRTRSYHISGRTLSFRSCVLQQDGEPIDDISDDQHADGTLDTIHRLISELKRRGAHIHLSVSGGRRMMGLLATSVAALHFDRYDHVWHLYTPPEIQERAREGAMMHVPADAGIRLIKGPFIALGAYINPISSFRNAQEQQREQMDAQERARCATVEREATSRQVKVLQAFARGLHPQQVAEELTISLNTVHYHKTALLQLCRNAWNLDPQQPLDYHFLQIRFAHYFQLGV